MNKGRGFSLVEVLVALSVVGIAASTLLLASASTVESGSDVKARLVARGLAEQMLDDLLGQPYCEPGTSPTTWPLGPESGESSLVPKTILFDDSDDYHLYRSSPPRDRWGIEAGQGDGQGGRRRESFRLPDEYFAGWQVELQVTYANENNPSLDLPASQTSGLRAARVRISRTVNQSVEELILLRRVFAYVPSTSN